MRFKLASAQIEGVAEVEVDEQVGHPVVEDLVGVEAAQVGVQRRLHLDEAVSPEGVHTHTETADLEEVIVALVGVHIEVVELGAAGEVELFQDRVVVVLVEDGQAPDLVVNGLLLGGHGAVGVFVGNGGSGAGLRGNGKGEAQGGQQSAGSHGGEIEFHSVEVGV